MVALGRTDVVGKMVALGRTDVVGKMVALGRTEALIAHYRDRDRLSEKRSRKDSKNGVSINHLTTKIPIVKTLSIKWCSRTCTA